MLRYLALACVSLSSVNAELIATFTQGGETDVRIDRLAALDVPQGQPPTPFLAAGKFQVVWKGGIELAARQRLYFSFEGEGSVSLTIDGKPALSEEGKLGLAKSKRLRLNPGIHQLEITYASAEDGSGNFRIYWEEERGMPRQTIPPTAYAVEPTEAAALGQLQRRGRMAFAQQNCAKCHAAESGFGPAPMPEMGEIAPILAGIGDRVGEEWLRKWIADPKAMNPATHMPTLVDSSKPEGRQQASDLAAYLGGMKMGTSALAAPDPSIAKDGGAYFHELGCIACHYPAGENASADGTHRIPLNNTASKYLPGHLTAYLKKPDAYHPFTGMPDFQLSDEEAVSIAAFLTEQSRGKGTEMAVDFPEGDPTRGASVAESLQCGTCHPGLPGGVSTAPSLEAIFKADWSAKGCAAEADVRPELPVMNFHKGDRKALLAFSHKGPDSLKKDSSVEFATRQIGAKRCTACHSIDEEVSLLNTLHGSTAALAAHIEGLEERVDQTRPQFTFIGEMLYTTYIESMLAGTVQTRPRPWLGTRMPAFRAYAAPMAEGLSRLHGFEPSGPIKVDVKAELAAIGEELVGAKGFACTTCHAIGDQGPTAAFEVGAVNFHLVPDRLREGYYYRWMDHPAAVVPGNKMPRYADGPKSQRTDILDGDASSQYQAIWQWLHSK